MQFTFTPIGTLHTPAQEIPRHWSVSQVKGEIEIDPAYAQGLQDIAPGQHIVVIFVFDRSHPFVLRNLVQKPPHKNEELGVFSTCSPRRPNPIGMSVLQVLEAQGCKLLVQGVDMLDKTPILDIKPYIELQNVKQQG
ncbi:MAG: tRNA (N6-threonylcarbamoyladenosine(37)-N6)-methyltransferase TrmO [Desulfohalobiaceae bacterium]